MFLTDAGHSTDFQVRGDNSIVQGGLTPYENWFRKTSMQNKVVFYFQFDIFIFENQ